MNRLQFISLLIPCIGSFVLVILGWMFSNARLGRIEAAVGSIQHDLQEFYRINGKLEGRVEETSSRVK